MTTIITLYWLLKCVQDVRGLACYVLFGKILQEVDACVCRVTSSHVHMPHVVIYPSCLLQVQQMMIGVAGFLCYKLAIVGVMTLPPLFPQRN